MPISINDFQNTLDSSKIKGFVKLSDDGAVKSYGGGFFARHFGLYSKPSAEENNAVRRAFYESVMDSFHCRGELLAFLRQELGIAENGTSTSGQQLSVRQAKEILQHVKAVVAEQSANVEERQNLLEDLAKRGFLVGAVRQHIVNSLGLENQDVAETKLNSDVAKDIRHYAMDATTNRKVRQDLFEQLQKEGLCQGEIGAEVRTMLHLDDEEAVLTQLTPADRKAITDFAKNSSARVHAERIAAHKLPTAEEIEVFVSPDKLDFCKAILANPGASEQEIDEIAMHINSVTIAKEHDNWTNEVKGALTQFTADIGVDCSSLQEQLLQTLEKQMNVKFVNQETKTPVDKEQIRGEFTTALNQMLSDRKAIVDGIAAAPNLPGAVADYLRNAAATLPEFCKPAQLQTLLKYAEPLQTFLRLATAESVTEAKYLDAVDAMVASLKQGGAEYAAKVTDGLADTKDSQFSRLICEMSRLAVEAEKGQPLAENGDRLKAMMTRQIQQDKLVLDMITQGKGDYRGGKAAINALNDEVAQICEVAKHCGLEIELPPEGKPEMPTPEFDKHLERLDISRAIKNITDGNHFDITLRSAFKEAFLDSFNDSLARADQSGKYPDVAHAFAQDMRDYCRTGTGLKVGDDIITRVNDYAVDSNRADRQQEMIDKLEQFFGEDQVNGMRAARIIGDITHQGFMGSFLGSMMGAKEPCDIMLSEDREHVLDFSLRRDQNGNYNIHFTGVFNYRSIMEDGKRIWLDPSQSPMRYNFDLTLSFDAKDGKPILQFAQSPTMSGRLTQMGRDIDDYGKLRELNDPLDGTSFAKITEISGVLHDLTVQHTVFETENPDDAIRLLRSRVITKSDLELLDLLGFRASAVSMMVLGCAGDENTPRLGKEIIGRLLKPATREAAINDLKAMAQPIVNAGWLDRLPDIHPEILNLISVAGLSTVSFQDGQSDAELVHKFIAESQDPTVKSLPADLQSDNPETVEAAKARVQELSHTLRRGLGLQLLSTHFSGVTEGQIRLIEKHIPQDRYRGMLQHIAARDEDFDQSIEGFEGILKAIQVIQKEEAAMNPNA